jgi:Flp pilus assembly protein TadD
MSEVSIEEALRVAWEDQLAGRLGDSESIYRQILAHLPDHPEALHGLGLVAGRAGDADSAIGLIRRAISNNPLSPAYHYNLGVALNEKGRLEEAIESYRKTIQLKPDYTEAHNNLGVALRETGQFEEAIGEYRRAITIQPDFADAHWNLAQSLLLTGDFAQGWQEYEWRWKVPSLTPRRAFSQPQWNGQALGGRTILLHAEQGFGDTIQFVRYAQCVAERGGRVILESPPELARLLAGCAGVGKVIARGEPLPAFEAHSSLASLPFIFSTDLKTIPADVPYLLADGDLHQRWNKRLGNSPGRRKVGLVWSGRPNYKDHRKRAVDLSQLAPLAKIPDLDFYSLQIGDPAKQPRPAGMKLTDFPRELTDFAQTAAVIANLDLIVTVDTAVAHLAGAMGRPTWVLLPSIADWRWMRERSDSPWYPTMRLIRQKARGDWEGAVQVLAAQLAEGANQS